MPYKHAPYISLDEAVKNKRAIFGDLAVMIRDVAKALATDDQTLVDELLAHVRPRRRENVFNHAQDLVGFFR